MLQNLVQTIPTFQLQMLQRLLQFISCCSGYWLLPDTHARVTHDCTIGQRFHLLKQLLYLRAADIASLTT